MAALALNSLLLDIAPQAFNRQLPSFAIGFVIAISFNKADYELTGSLNSFYLN